MHFANSPKEKLESFFVTGYALSDSCHVVAKSDWTHSTDFAVWGSRRQGSEKQSSFQWLGIVHLWVLDSIPSMN